MGRFTLILIGIVLSLYGYSQGSLFVLHPLVGDTIDKNEKFNYLLFRNTDDANFKYCTLTHTKNAYFVHVCSPNSVVSTSEIDSTELKRYIVNLDKVMEYYAKENKKDSLTSNIKIYENLYDSRSKGANNSFINENSKDKILKAIKVENRMKEDAERSKNIMNGTEFFGPAHVEFPAIKRKKKK